MILRWFWSLLPANPLIVRTVAGGSRRMRHQWVRTGYLAALVALVALGLMTGGAMTGRVSLTQLAKAGTHVFAIVGYGQVSLICLLAPLFFAGAIATEQSGRTYDILLTTPLSNLQIVLGSLGGRLFFVLALLASGLPLFAVLLIFGGVPIRAVFVCFATSAMAALIVGAAAVTLSVLRAGGRKAVFVFVISIAFFLVAAYLTDVFLLRPNTTQPHTTTWLTPLHPLLVVEASLNSANYRPPSWESLGTHAPLVRWYLSRPFTAFTVLTFTASAALVLACTLVLRRLAQSDGHVLRELLARLRSGHQGAERRRPAHEVRGNPISWREAHCRSHHVGGLVARWMFLILGLGTAMVALTMYHAGSIRPKTFEFALITMLLVELAVIVLVALYVSAGAISGEREDGTMDLMLTTPMTPRHYIWGKLSGLVRFLSLLLATPISTALIVALYALIGRVGQWHQAMVSSPLRGTGAPGNFKHELLLLETPLLVGLILIPFTALCVTIGMNWSLKSKSVIGAIVPALGLIGTVVVVMGFCGWSAAESVPFVGPIINAFSPSTCLVMFVNPWERVEQFAQAQGTGRMTLVIAALIAGSSYSLIAYTMLQTMVKGFDQTIRRLSGTN